MKMDYEMQRIVADMKWEVKMIQHNHKAAQMRAWIKRRTDKGITATSDDIWAQINKRWPELNENEREYIWQEAEQVPIARERARLAAKMALNSNYCGQMSRMP